MTDATHFIEVYKAGNSQILKNGIMLDIKHLESELNHTSYLRSLKTIAVWKIKLKKSGL